MVTDYVAGAVEHFTQSCESDIACLTLSHFERQGASNLIHFLVSGGRAALCARHLLEQMKLGERRPEPGICVWNRITCGLPEASDSRIIQCSLGSQKRVGSQRLLHLVCSAHTLWRTLSHWHTLSRDTHAPPRAFWLIYKLACFGSRCHTQTLLGSRNGL